MPQNRLGLLGHHLRAGDDAVDGHGAHHQRHHRVGRDAEREQRDEGGLRAGVVGRFRPGHALDGARAEARRVLGELLLQRIGRERPQHRAVAGQDAQDRADAASRARSGRADCARSSRDRAAAGRSAPCTTSRACVGLEVAQDLGEAEQAHGEHREVEAVGELGRSRRSGAPRRSRDRCRPWRAGARAASWRSPSAPSRARAPRRTPGPAPSARSSRPGRTAAPARVSGAAERGDDDGGDAAGEERADAPRCRAPRRRGPAWPSGGRRASVTTEVASPGMLTRMAVVEPPYCAP